MLKAFEILRRRHSARSQRLRVAGWQGSRLRAPPSLDLRRGSGVLVTAEFKMMLATIGW